MSTNHFPVTCVSVTPGRIVVNLLDEKDGKALYCFCHPREADELSIYNRPIAEFREMYKPAGR
jgi:hypothetical protein